MKPEEMKPEETRSHETVIEIHATPDEVFRAITEADQIVKWFAPEARVEPGPDGQMIGGSYTISWGGPGAPSMISAWEPGKRFSVYKDRTKPYDSEGTTGAETGIVRRVMVDYIIEAVDGSTTRLRLVQSGFGPEAAWDNELESTKTGWKQFLQKLKEVLESKSAAA